MSDSALDWLDARAADVPASLHRRMRAAVAGLPADAISEVEAADTTDPSSRTVTGAREGVLPLRLAAAALACLRDAGTAGDSRDAALHLLAADALMTDACEAAADDAAMIRRLATGFSAQRLDALTSTGEAP